MSRIGSLRIWACLALGLTLGACGWVDVRPDSERTVRQPAPPPAAPVAEVDEPGVIVVDGVRYVEVKPGDTVFGIANQYDATPNQLIRLNRLGSPFMIQVGQRLRLPARQRLHRVRSGETLTSIARRYDVAPETIAAANGLAPPYMVRADETLGVPAGATVVAARPVDASPPSGVARRAPARAMPRTGDRQGVKVEELPPPATSAGRQGTSAAAPSPQAPPTPAPPTASVSVEKPAPAPKPSAAKIEPAPQSAAPEQTQPAQTELARVEPTAPPPASATPPGGPSLATPGIRGGFLAPIDGPVIAGFGSQEDGRRNDGVNVAAPRGAPVRAAADGEVVYAGDALQGYGNLILVRHGDGWVTAYAHLDSILAKRGETVKRGQTIGSVGSSGGVGAPQLHFEMRQNNKAVDPIGRLAPT